MSAEQASLTPKEQEQLRKALLTGDPMSRTMKRLFRLTPSSPRCKLCFAPFGGLGRWLLRPTSFKPSRKNPQFCRT